MAAVVVEVCTSNPRLIIIISAKKTYWSFVSAVFLWWYLRLLEYILHENDRCLFFYSSRNWFNFRNEIYIFMLLKRQLLSNI